LIEEPFNERDRCIVGIQIDILSREIQSLFSLSRMDYDPEKVRRIIYEAGLISSYKSTSILKTNCLLNQLMSYVDLRIDGNFNMLPYIGFLIRNGFSQKKEWTSTVFLVENILLRSKNPSIKKLEKDFGNKLLMIWLKSSNISKSVLSLYKASFKLSLVRIQWRIDN
jgi:hypothetical protein